MGKTIVGARGRDRSVELERMATRKRERRRKVVVGFLGLCMLGGLVVLIVVGIGDMAREQDEASDVVVNLEPSLEIVVEGGGSLSARVREFVARVERDFADLGFVASRAVLPLGMSRQVDFYVEGRKEYYKMSVDRGSAVQVEDAERMMRYLDGKKKKAQYVDLRLEGKAYYK